MSEVGDIVQPGQNDLAVHFLAEDAQPAEEVAGWLAEFIGGAQQSLDFALYDCRLRPPVDTIFRDALRERAAAGVAIRFVYDADKPEPPMLANGMDPAEAGTGAFIRGLGFPYRRVGGPKLMHQKFVIRDGKTEDARVWTGSANFTNDAWSLQENNLLMIASPAIAAAYARDFDDLWREGENEGTGEFDVPPAALTFGGSPLTLQLYFSPGRGLVIDEAVANRVAGARRRVRICSMLLNSGTLLNALLDLLNGGQVPVDGLHDRTQMADVLRQWEAVPHNHWKIGAIRDIVARARLAGKDSRPYRPDTPHDFMHNKFLIVDDTVITGSYNFSRSAQFNAENLLMLENVALAAQYSEYLDRLLTRYH